MMESDTHLYVNSISIIEQSNTSFESRNVARDDQDEGDTFVSTKLETLEWFVAI